MTIDFICEELAELFGSPCNYSPMDEKMFQDSYCESHCGKVTDKECWKRYFEKVWADRKTENNSEIPNSCEDCIWSVCNYNKAFEDEPQTERVHIVMYEPTNAEILARLDAKDEPQTGEMMTEEEFDSMLARVLTGNNEPQTDTEIAKAIVHKMIDDAVIAEDAYPDLRQKMHDAVDEYEPQTKRSE